jgi:hypothetical protein
MKVLKRPNTDWSYKHTCLQCGAELEVEKSDVSHTYYPGDFRDPTYEQFMAKCAVCSSQFTVPNNVIPKIVQFEISQKKILP